MTFEKMISVDRRQEQERFELTTSMGREALRQVEIANRPKIVSTSQTSTVSTEGGNAT